MEKNISNFQENVENPIKNKKRKNKLKINKIQLFILYFFIFAFLGWLMETIFAFILSGHFVKRGFLYGPICPIYGYGGVMLIVFLGKYRSNKFKLFVYSAILFSAFEYFVGYGLDALFSMKWWDYTNDFLNLNGRISIFYSISWGVIAIVFLNYIYPFFKKILNRCLSKIPYSVQVKFVYFLCAVWLFDTLLSSIGYLN